VSPSSGVQLRWSCTSTYHKGKWGMEMYLHIFLMFTLDGGELSVSCSSCYTIPSAYWIGGPRAICTLWKREKSRSTAGNYTKIPQSLDSEYSHYKNCNIVSPSFHVCIIPVCCLLCLSGFSTWLFSIHLWCFETSVLCRNI